MKIQSRLTYEFCDLKVDVVEETIFKNSHEPIQTIENLIGIIQDLCKLTDREFIYEIRDDI